MWHDIALLVVGGMVAATLMVIVLSALMASHYGETEQAMDAEVEAGQAVLITGTPEALAAYWQTRIDLDMDGQAAVEAAETVLREARG